MKNNIKVKNIIKGIAAAFGFLVLYSVVTNLVGLGMQGYFSLTHSELKITDPLAYAEQLVLFAETNIMYRAIVQFLLFIAVLLIFFRIKNIKIAAYVRWNPVSGRNYALVALMSSSAIIALNFFMNVLIPADIAQSAADYTTMMTSGGLLINIVLVILVGPFSEELLIRGLMTTRMMGRLPLWAVIAGPALIFGLGHAAGGMSQVIGTIMTGLVMSLVFVWTNSMRASVLAHMLNNLFAAFLPWSMITTAISVPIQFIIGIVGLIVAVYAGYMLYKRWDKEAMLSI